MPFRSRDIACALALIVAAAFWVRAVQEPRPPPGPDPADDLDPRFERLRRALPAHARVGLLLPMDPFATAGNPERYYLAQYGLAPFLVRPIVAGDCMAHGTNACGAEQVDFFIVEAPKQAEVEAVEAQLGLAPVAVADGVVLSRRRP